MGSCGINKIRVTRINRDPRIVMPSIFPRYSAILDIGLVGEVQGSWTVLGIIHTAVQRAKLYRPSILEILCWFVCQFATTLNLRTAPDKNSDRFANISPLIQKTLRQLIQTHLHQCIPEWIPIQKVHHVDRYGNQRHQYHTPAYKLRPWGDGIVFICHWCIGDTKGYEDTTDNSWAEYHPTRLPVNVHLMI